MSTTTTPTTNDAGFAGFKAALEALPSAKRLNRDQIEAIYGLGYQLLAQGQLEKAHGYFSMLSMYAPTDVKVLTATAQSAKLTGRYDEAVYFHNLCAQLDPRQPQHTLAIAECQMLQDAPDEARETLGLVVRYCAEHAESAAVGKRAQALLELMGPARAVEDATA